MPFEGSLGTVSFPDLLQLLGSTRKTGTLWLERGNDWKKVYLRDGAVIGLSSNDPDEFVSQTLVALGKVSEADMGSALARQPREGRLIGAILVAEGKISEADLRRYLSEKGYDMVAKLLGGWEQARFRFEEFALPAQEMLALDLSPEELLMEGFRRADEVARFRELVPDEQMVLERAGEAPADLLEQTLVGSVLRKLDRPRSVRELRQSLKASEFSLLQGVSSLLERGIVRRGERPGPEAPPATWLADGRKFLLAGLAREAMLELRRGLKHEPGNQEARELLRRAEESFVAQAVRERCPLDAVPVLRCSLEELADRSLSPIEAFILTRVDGKAALGELLEAIPLPAAETLLALEHLLDGEYVELRRG